MRPPNGIVEKEVEEGIEPKSQVSIVFTGPFQYDGSHRVVIRALGDIVQTRLRDLVREELGGTYSIGAGGQLHRNAEQNLLVRLSSGAVTRTGWMNSSKGFLRVPLRT